MERSQAGRERQDDVRQPEVREEVRSVARCHWYTVSLSPVTAGRVINFRLEEVKNHSFLLYPPNGLKYYSSASHATCNMQHAHSWSLCLPTRDNLSITLSNPSHCGASVQLE